MQAKDTTLTPLWLIEQLGGFDFDPCAYPGHATAKHLNVLPSDGLSADWFGRVWCNPPYSCPLPWVHRMMRHGNGVMLVLASTDTVWFQEAAKSAGLIFFPRGRPTFERQDGSPVKLMRASALLAWGECVDNLRSIQMRGFFASP